jgi:hypothetical protein
MILRWEKENSYEGIEVLASRTFCSEAQKAFILKQGAVWDSHRGDLPPGRDQPGDLLQLEEEARRAAADGDEAAEAAGGRERQTLFGRRQLPVRPLKIA